MHIMMVPSWYWNKRNKVHGSFFKEQALSLKEHGVRVTVAYNEIWPITLVGKINEKSGLSFENDEGLHTYRLKGFNFIPKHPMMFKLFNYRMEKLYKAVLKSEGKVDVIHAQSSLWGGISAAYVAKKYNIPLLITEHSSVERGVYVRESYLPTIINSYKSADKVIAVGNGLKKELEILSGRDDIEVIPNLVDFLKFTLKEERTEKEDFIFFSLAFLEGEKGFDTLIKAFSLEFKFENAKLVIGGDGSQRPTLEELARREGVSNKVEFLGALSREEVSEWMQKCQCFVLPSRYETFGVVYIEALASGTPVIGTFNGGAEDIINMDNGYIVNVDDVDALAKAMKSMENNIGNFNSEKIRENCLEKFRPEVITGKIIEAYKSVM